MNLRNFFYFFIFLISLLINPSALFAQTSSSFVSVVNPVRGQDFWELKNQKIEDAVLGQAKILDKYSLNATWLIRFDVLDEKGITTFLNNRKNDEKGIFLEITPKWTDDAKVTYGKSFSWHSAGSAFLSGYQLDEREKLIDTAFEKFKSTFGFYPKSVGAWWVDARSLQRMEEKYGVTSLLIVADQYTTDNYQIWGQYWSTPYYPSKNHLLHPAQSLDTKLPVVITQWAARDPVNAYGNGVLESTFSVQANDYIDYHNLDTSYFKKLIDIYTRQEFNKFGQVVVGLENSYEWAKYSTEYENQIKVLKEKKTDEGLQITTMSQFSDWYQKTFPNLSPDQVIIAEDPLGSYKKVVWFMNPYYRAGWFVNQNGGVFRDIRQYTEGEELCFNSRCDSVNFASFATRVLDEVSFGHKWILDEGKISDFKVEKEGNVSLIKYKNEAGKERIIEFLRRDISIDKRSNSIDSLIFEATKDHTFQDREKTKLEKGFFQWSAESSILKIIKFLVFLIIGCLIPGFLLINKAIEAKISNYQKIVSATILGIVLFTFIFYVLSILGLKQFIFVYLFINLILLFKNYQKIFAINLSFAKSWINFVLFGLVLAGTVFQQLPAFKNGLIFPYGIGFWGPNTHDGVWHISLINQLIKSTPPQNPIFSGEILKNYHFFYDLLVAATSFITTIPIMDLVFRFYPILFSISLGVGTYYLIKNLFGGFLNNFQTKLASLFSIYLVYFAGSLGWIVEYIKVKHLGGESAFWANQSISFNLNPPFAISLLVVITILLILPSLRKRNLYTIISLTLLSGTLIVFKSYAGILIILSLLSVGILKKSLNYLITFITSSILAAVLFLTNFSIGEKLIIFSPFWFIHSMVDSPDRVGWVRLSLARTVGWETKNWSKFFTAEIISLVLFVLGNLGTRFFALFTLFKIKTIFSNSEFLFIFVFSVLSLTIPILFIQAGNPWNTIQFMYYFLYISALISGIVILNFLKLVKIPAALIVIICIALTPINSWATANSYLSYNPHAWISRGELEALDVLRNKEDGVVLTFPFDEKLKNKISEPWPIIVYDTTAYVSALSNKSVFLEDESQNKILLTEYKKRKVASLDFFLSPSPQSNEFIVKFNIKYIYLPKIFKIKLDEQIIKINKIFENNEILIYETKK